jgi:hypothetical protein
MVMKFHYSYFAESDAFLDDIGMILKYICQRNTEMYRRQLIKYEEVMLNVTDMKKNQQMTILRVINQLLGEFGLLKHSVNSLCEAMHEEQPSWWGDGHRVCEATRDMKKWLELNERWIATITSTGLEDTPSADLPLRNKASVPGLGVWAPFSQVFKSQLFLILLLGINSTTG